MLFQLRLWSRVVNVDFFVAFHEAWLIYHAYLTIPSRIVCNSSTGESLVGSNPFQNLANKIAKSHFKLTSECEMAIDYLVLMFIHPFP